MDVFLIFHKKYLEYELAFTKLNKYLLCCKKQKNLMQLLTQLQKKCSYLNLSEKNRGVVQVMAVSKKRHICPFDRACSNGCSVVQPLDLFELSDASSGVSWHRDVSGRIPVPQVPHASR